MNDEHWRKVVLRLLEHFDNHEGTTYLYHEGQRRQFVEETEAAVRGDVERLLAEYHNRPKL